MQFRISGRGKTYHRILPRHQINYHSKNIIYELDAEWSNWLHTTNVTIEKLGYQIESSPAFKSRNLFRNTSMLLLPFFRRSYMIFIEVSMSYVCNPWMLFVKKLHKKLCCHSCHQLRLSEFTFNIFQRLTKSCEKEIFFHKKQQHRDY